MKYIDADKFIKKFEKMIDDIPASVDSGAGYVIDEVYKIFDSLQQEQPQVADASKTLDGLMEEVKRYYSENYAYITSDQPTLSILTNIARHFYELGLRARKKE